ncbi:septum formation family protein [Arthrobacter sp. ISL-72]|uniref:septum formation family protein n=1 Tax=Arthrobacter sp. ISL-72 TaxID=2819114 RepID=UPI001BEA23D8|nr:septum formation family protein [Arthrobacter sp. ISL-72]MBT2593854.1 septum formation family protein [Arthrobacter sp. ISL-72]
MTDENTSTSAGNRKATPGSGMPPVIPPPPARPPTSSLPVQQPAGPPTNNRLPKDNATGKPAKDNPPTSNKSAAERRQTLLKVGFVAGALVVLGLLVWGLVALLASGSRESESQPTTPAPAASESASPSAQPTRSQLPQDGVSALDYQLGDCFESFDPEATESRVVACTTGHSAQLVAVHRYAESDSYPGIDALRKKGREICQGAGLTDAVANYVLMQRNAYPSDTSWDQGDRRVDCYVTADKGNVIMESLLP